MRQNGLRASSFVPVVDVDPRVADQLLDLLRLADVAAYSEPAPGSTGVYRDHHVSHRRLDRLWVDRAETLRARGVLDRALPHLQAELELAIRDGVIINLESAADSRARSARAEVAGVGEPGSAGAADGAARHSPELETAGLEPAGLQNTAGTPGPAAETPAGDGPDGLAPEPPRPPAGVGTPDEPGPGRSGSSEPSLEESWAQIVSGFDLPVSGPTPWPSAEDLPGSRITRLRRPVRSTAIPTVLPAIREGDPLDEAHFVPPAPLPLPHLDPMTRLGWAAVVGGPVLLVLVVVFGSSLPSWVPLLGVLVLVGGFGLLVSRLRPSSDDDDDHHDGAVV